MPEQLYVKKGDKFVPRESPTTVITVRMTPTLHKAIVTASRARGTSINRLCVDAIERSIENGEHA